MTFELLKKSGYKINSTDDMIVVTLKRRLSTFLVATLLTILIAFAVAYAKRNDNVFLRTSQYLTFSILIMGPSFLLVILWRHRIIIQKGRIQIRRAFKGYTDCHRIVSIDIKTQQSFIKKDVTILINDFDNGLNKLFVVSVAKKDLGKANDFVNEISEYIGLQRSELVDRTAHNKNL
jgi:hypothetical protein